MKSVVPTPEVDWRVRELPTAVPPMTLGVVNPPNVGVLAVAMDCGSESVTVPVGDETMIWFAVPVSEITAGL